MNASLVALVDGNNFYCSCEAAFRPSLAGRPMVVLSNNDGCAISRSQEAKALGIKMSQPWHEIRHLEREAGLVSLSANFPLYGDMSDRMMGIIGSFAPRQSIYSIDECFLDLAGMPGDMVGLGRAIRARVLQDIGIATCVGIGSTKTRAKFANNVAKTVERKPGLYPSFLARVCNLESLPAEQLDTMFEATEVGEVWGIGRRISAQLEEGGIRNVKQLLRIDPSTIRQNFSVVLERTVRELGGTPCLDLEDAPGPKQQIMCSRSFGSQVERMDELIEAISEFASRAAEKLRRQESAAGAVLVFVTTSPFRKKDKQYSRTVTVPLVRPTFDTNHLVRAAVAGLRAIYKPGFRFAKAGVMLVELQPDGQHQGELDFGTAQEEGVDRGRLMKAVDAINGRFGRGSVLVASAGLAGDRRSWVTKQQRRTPQYTTRLEDIPLVRA